jgi:hypothetical protein
MKNNNFLIALALCLGLSSTGSFCGEGPAQESLSRASFPVTTSPKKPTSTWRDWFSPEAWSKSIQSRYQALHARAAAALSGTLELTNAIKKGVGMENVTYSTLGAVVAALYAMNYNKETILNIVGSVYDYIAAPSIKLIGAGAKLVGRGVGGGLELAGRGVVGGAKLVGSGAQYVATTPALAIPTAVAAGALIVNEMDKANARKKAQQGKGTSSKGQSAEEFESLEEEETK